jgi:PAS domain-containing protein
VRYIVMPVRALRTDVPRVRAPEARAPEVIVLPIDALAQWGGVVTACGDPCLVVDGAGVVAAVSRAGADLLGTAADCMVGESLDATLRLVDFIDNALEAQGVARRIPPLIALAENALSRGVMRVLRPDGGLLLLDAVAAPIHDGTGMAVGSVSFLTRV